MRPMQILVLLLVTSIVAAAVPAAAQTDIAKLRIDLTPSRSVHDLVNLATLVVVGWPDVAHETSPTGQRIGEYRLVNYAQRIHVKRVMKGESQRIISLLTTGAEPLPNPSHRLNEKYTGPIAEGDYLFFLRRVRDTDLYSLVGIWQGLYPIINDRTIALRGAGYPDFNDLTIDQAETKVRTLMKRRS
ncbi:MAG: hypothetical protein H0Z34_12630 [Brevibacillus sp.]|nr:hypothetical protein [Brevibacillus sp.]